MLLRRSLILGAILILLAPGLLRAQTTPEGESLPDLSQFPIDPTKVHDPEDVPEHMRPAAVIRGGQVPYATRAQSLLTLLGGMEEASENTGGVRPVDVALENLGLDPESSAARDLVARAVKYRADYHQSIRDRVGKSEAEQQAMEVEAYRLAGQVFGQWLADREKEGFALIPLIDRLLNAPNHGMTLAVSNGTQEEFERVVAQREEAFREELRTVLGWLPGRFQ